jgi:hypothetical protein
MSTNQNLKDALTFTSDGTTPIVKEGKTVGNVALSRAQAYLEGQYQLKDGDGNPRAATADDLSAWLWYQISRAVKSYEENLAKNTLPVIDDLDEGS